MVGGFTYFSKTTDGGNNWFVTDSLTWDDPFEFGASVISFTDTLNGWSFGDTFYRGDLAGIIFRTTDGGYNWYPEHVGLTRDINDAIMIDKYHGWAVGRNGVVLAYVPLTNVIENIG